MLVKFMVLAIFLASVEATRPNHSCFNRVSQTWTDCDSWNDEPAPTTTAQPIPLCWNELRDNWVDCDFWDKEPTTTSTSAPIFASARTTKQIFVDDCGRSVFGKDNPPCEKKAGGENNLKSPQAKADQSKTLDLVNDDEFVYDDAASATHYGALIGLGLAAFIFNL
ncbi:unnamed protein product [Bursaphelenchus okinawaensis]|uniref:Uncharacterized protein n=1 Tax=Bursaphelenchus okinawaensis TaxID=465554 RepID=A0A811LQD0_9BILA|nr:unnamed protein product [Bursaphelenchus okinawaensis]CAG9127862.1 unnamed protein product [Bursaphelenchus okinawaensis]